MHHPPLRAAVVGLGMMGHVGVVALERDPAWAVAAVADRQPAAIARARSVAPQAVVVDDADELVDASTLDRLGIDAVFVMTPPSSHASLAVAALGAGRHVICEKPMARNPVEGQLMLDADTGHAVAVIDHQLRYNRARLHIHDQLARGAFGTPVHVSVTATFPSLRTTPWTWWSSSDEGGGLLNEYGSHTVDLLHWWFGRSIRATGAVRTVTTSRADASGIQRPVDSDDLALFRLDWSDGLVADVTLSGVAQRFERTITIHTTDLTAVLDADDRLHLHRPNGDVAVVDLAERDPSLIGDPVETYTQPFARLVTDVAAAIHRGGRPDEATTFGDGVAVITRLDDVRRSSANSSEDRL